ncbi:MAG: hypothetical protein RR334_03400 [Clostridia bacterium]
MKPDIFQVLNVIDRFKKTHQKFKTIKADPEQRSTSTFFAKRSIIFSVVGAFLIPLLLWLLVASLDSGNVIFAIFGAVIAIVAIIAIPIPFIIQNLILIIYQLRLNKKAIGWVALGLYIIMTIAIVLIPLLLTGTI